MLEEIHEIPERARDCHQRNKGLRLPERVPYLGMGSSFFAALALKYLGKPLICETASDYAMYFSTGRSPLAVLISQSGQSSEVLWNRGLFAEYHSIVNELDSPLARGDNCSQVVPMHAGSEVGSATKSYVNTLVTLYCGHGLDPCPAIRLVKESMGGYEDWGRSVAKAVKLELDTHPQKGLVVLGNGANLATAHQAALILAESIHRPVVSMPVAQFDHGPKEALGNSIVLIVDTNDPEKERTGHLKQLISLHGGTFHAWEESALPYFLSPISCSVPFFYLAAYLSSELGVEDVFAIGGKVTKVDPD